MLKFSLFSADLIMSIKRVVEFTVLKFLFSADLIQSLSTLSLSLSLSLLSLIHISEPTRRA